MPDSGNISVNYDGAVDRLHRAKELGHQQRDAHTDSVPDFAPAAAGRDFTAHGQRLAGALQRAHNAGTRQVDSIIAVAQAGLAQLEVIHGADGEFGAHLGGRK